MRVLLLDVNCKYSSTGKIVYDLYTQLNADGHTAAIAYGRGDLVREKNIYRFAPKWEVYLHALLTRITGYTGCFSPIATRRLFKFMDEFKPDVVHLNDMHGYFVNIIPLIEYLKKKKIKTVWTFHCEFMYTGKCGHAYECEKWKSECGHCPYLKDYPQSMVFDKTAQMFHKKKDVFENWKGLTIVTPSEWLKDRVKQSFLKEYSVKIIYNGLDTNIFFPHKSEHLKEKLGIKNEKVILAVAPNLLSERKGGRYVIELAEKMTGENVKVVMVGTGDSTEKHGENIINIGDVKDAKLLAEYYSMADVFVLCSKRETFSMTTVEALCCGTPVAGFLAGAPETVALKQYSSFVSYGDMDSLKREVQRILTEEWGKDVERIAEMARKSYSRQTMYKKYKKIYCEFGSLI